jgi:hypothetical protein
VQPFADASRVAALQLAWEQAAEDLDIRVITEGARALDPFRDGSSGGRSHHGPRRWDAHLRALRPTARRVISERAQGFTELSSGYDGYDRDTFIEALCDWGWTGEGSSPSWYAAPQEDDEPLGDMPNSGT